jgi:hypothetical protein
MYMRFELYGKKTGAKSINSPVKNYAEILGIVKKEVPDMFLNITLSEREICETVQKKMWIDDDCKSELDIEKDNCDRKKGEGYIWRDNRICVHRDQLTCKGTWVETEKRCKNEAEMKCEKEAGKAWLNGACVSQNEQACKDFGKSAGEEYIWDGSACKPKKQRDCELLGKEWIGNACKDKGQAECEYKGHAWIGNRCVAPSAPAAPKTPAPASDSYSEYSSPSSYTEYSAPSSYTEYSSPSYTEYSSPSMSSASGPVLNFSKGRRVLTGVLNFSVPGLGSIVLMNDWGGAIATWIIMGIGIGAAATGSEDTEVAAGAVVAASGWLYSTFIRPVMYDKPGSVNAAHSEGFNFAVIPNRHGDFMPAVTYNKAF